MAQEERPADIAGTDRPLAEIAIAGPVAGIVAGVAMALVLMVWWAAVRGGFWMPMRAMGGLFYGPAALNASAWPVVVGLIVHLGVSATIGALFSMMVRPSFRLGTTFLGGLVYGVLVWAIMTWMVLPWADPMLATRLPGFHGPWFVAHLVYGGVLGLTPAFERVLAPGRTRWPVPSARHP